MAGFPLDKDNRVILLDIPFQDRTDAVRDLAERILVRLDDVFDEGFPPEEKPN